MQQDLPSDMPLANANSDENVDDNKNVKEANKPKNTNVFKIISIISSVLTLCGIAFGIVCVVQLHQKNDQIASLEAKIDDVNHENPTQEPEEPEGDDETTNPDAINNLLLIGDLSTQRKYYLGTTSLDPGQDAREKDMYIIDVTQLGSADGVKKYDLKPALEQAVAHKVAGLPDMLAEGTDNATPKSDCQSYRVTVLEPNNVADGIIGNWEIMTDWSDALPLGLYMACITSNGAELSLGSDLYSLVPSTNELFLVDKSGLTKLD